MKEWTQFSRNGCSEANWQRNRIREVKAKTAKEQQKQQDRMSISNKKQELEYTKQMKQAPKYSTSGFARLTFRFIDFRLPTFSMFVGRKYVF